MRGESTPVSRFRVFCCCVAVVMILAPAPFAPPSGFVVAVPAALTVGATLLPWPIGRVSLARVAVALGVLSLVVDIAYPGPRELALLWLPCEVMGLTILLGRVVRGVPGRRVGIVASLVGAAAVLAPLRFTFRSSPPDWRFAVAAVLMMMFPVALAVTVGLYLRALDDKRERAVAEARREQRLELARDLHDFVAHEVTGILLEVQAAQVRAYDPVENRALLARLEEAAQRALSSMDETLRALRDPGEAASLRREDLGELSGLVDRFRGMATAHAVLDLEEGLADRLPRQAQRAIFRVVLEALTNVRRHAAKATEVRVAVQCAGDTVEVTVDDDGGRGGLRGADRRGGGTGLIELNERVTALGGTLTAGPREKGWRVTASIPISR